MAIIVASKIAHTIAGGAIKRSAIPRAGPSSSIRAKFGCFECTVCGATMELEDGLGRLPSIDGRTGREARPRSASCGDKRCCHWHLCRHLRECYSGWMADRIRILKHEAVPKCGSYEVRFPDSRESKFFYFDDVPGRRMRPEPLIDEQAALGQARARQRF